MDPMTIASLGGMAINLGAGILGDELSKEDERKRRQLEEEAYRLYGDVSAPTLERVIAEKVSAGEWDAIPKDMGNRDVRNRALQRIVDMGTQGGLDAESRLALEEGRRASAMEEMQARGAVRSEARRRGMGGAGEVVGQLMAQQQGADRASLTGARGAADARSRALQALATGGGMAAQAEGQDFDRAARIAQSKDEINRFNSEMEYNARNARNAATQQTFQNDMGIRDRKYDATQRRAGQYGQDAERTRRRIGGIGQGIGYGVSNMGGFGGG